MLKMDNYTYVNMDGEEFINHYVDLLYEPVVDKFFNSPINKNKNGLSKIALFNRYRELYHDGEIKEATIRNDEEVIIEHLEDIIDVGLNEIGIQIDKNFNIQKDGLFWSVGNNKLGKEIGVSNCTSASLCPSAFRGQCSQCKNCYAKRDDNQYDSQQLRNTINYHKLLTNDNIIDETLSYMNRHKGIMSNFTDWRVNSAGDLLNTRMAVIVDNLCGAILDNFENIRSCYSYTHGKLEYKFQNIVMNYSDKPNCGVKSTIVAYEWDDKYLDTSTYAVCCGKCSNCSYCKDPDDMRIIVFFAHGGGLKGLKMVPEEYLEFFIRQTEEFNKKYLQRYIQQQVAAVIEY